MGRTCNRGAHAPRASGRTAGVEESPSRAWRYYKGSSLLHAWRAQACAVPSAAVLASWLQCTDWLPGISRTVSKDGTTMLHYAVVFFIIAVIAAALGFRGIAGMSATSGGCSRCSRSSSLVVGLLGGAIRGGPRAPLP